MSVANEARVEAKAALDKITEHEVLCSERFGAIQRQTKDLPTLVARQELMWRFMLGSIAIGSPVVITIIGWLIMQLLKVKGI